MSLMPIINSVANPDLRDKHWKKIYDKLEQPMVSGKMVSLNELLSFGIVERKEAIEEISARATGEKQIESQMDEIKTKWGELKFIVNSYREAKDKFIIGSVEEIMQTLDDHQLKIQSMMGSRYVAEIR
jgi:dynein heavy chain